VFTKYLISGISPKTHSKNPLTSGQWNRKCKNANSIRFLPTKMEGSAPWRLSSLLLQITTTSLHSYQKPTIGQWATARGTITESLKTTL